MLLVLLVLTLLHTYRVATQKQDSQSNSIMLDCTLSEKSSDQQMTGLDGQMYEVNHTSIYSGIR